MIPVPINTLKRLRLDQAIKDEAQSWQSLIPPAPGWDAVEVNIEAFSRWLKGQLTSGMPTVRQITVSARKVAHGIRPLPIWGFSERVTYRALVDFILRNEEPLDRSIETYLEFIRSPVTYAQSIEPQQTLVQRFLMGSSFVKYIVKADIASFYEYIDHGILGRELLTRTGDNEAIDCLMSLLAEVQGRTFGLPQLLDPSDRLSEVYIDIAERDILRRGRPAWRFNDDFRIATSDYSDALSAIEDLASAARELGLTLSDGKTTTPRYSTYLYDNFGLSADDEAPEELKSLQPEDAVGDYTEGVGDMDSAWAVKAIAEAYTPDMQPTEHGINLSNARNDEFRFLRRCLGRLIKAEIPDSLPHLLKLLAYMPALTPWAIRYLIRVGGQQLDQAATVLDDMAQKLSFSDWQRLWVIRAFDEIGALKSDAPGNPAIRIDWINGIRHGRHSPVVAAEAALALSAVNSISFVELEYALRDQPGALTPWHVSGIRRLKPLDAVNNEQYAAIRGGGGLLAALLPKESS